ncbi:hypothetical protein S1OALGB6SA_1853 [Olavius algarvensis spirochete endosymbiont]|uniref:hypothetical protein n=1 Tax=Olavius algarvensis spirochete endosymbiont TaxID=260710 RepID=UPI000A458438|nr:hypothetical protein [Olavius algarvensis spirochete endosymbiont]VDB00765.1 hypothetical protein S1OALGB6SA_1853 [Olavius algarvensis spirochete endosymbiont]
MSSSIGVIRGIIREICRMMDGVVIDESSAICRTVCVGSSLARTDASRIWR